MAMTKTQIIAAIAEKAEITKAQAESALGALVDLAYKGAEEGFTVPGLGNLTPIYVLECIPKFHR